MGASADFINKLQSATFFSVKKLVKTNTATCL